MGYLRSNLDIDRIDREISIRLLDIVLSGAKVYKTSKGFHVRGGTRTYIYSWIDDDNRVRLDIIRDRRKQVLFHAKFKVLHHGNKRVIKKVYEEREVRDWCLYE